MPLGFAAWLAKKVAKLQRRKEKLSSFCLCVLSWQNKRQPTGDKAERQIIDDTKICIFVFAFFAFKYILKTNILTYIMTFDKRHNIYIWAKPNPIREFPPSLVGVQ